MISLSEFPLSKITLIASISIDPRIKNIFKNVLYHHRPSSASYSLCFEPLAYSLPIGGPESCNASLEIFLKLGFLKYFLLAQIYCSSRKNLRSKNATGVSVRKHDIPLLGNHGRTVYTESSLVLSRDAMNSVLHYFSGRFSFSLFRLGVGLPLLNEQIINKDRFLSELSIDTQNSYTNDSINKNYYDIDPKEIIECASQTTDSLKVLIDEFLYELKGQSFWSASVSKT